MKFYSHKDHKGHKENVGCFVSRRVAEDTEGYFWS